MLFGLQRVFSPCQTSLISAAARRFKHRMTCPIPPPATVRGMVEWNPALFTVRATFPCLEIQPENINKAKKLLARYSVKIKNFKPILDSEPGAITRRLVILNPEKVKTFSDLGPTDVNLLQTLDVTPDNFIEKEFVLSNENWTPHEKLKAILPPDMDGVSGYSIIGHIIHLNLKEHLLPFKSVIGQILLEIGNTTTVVNKAATIDNTYRNFNLELLAGKEDYNVTVKENGVSFAFDFSKVYWNPKLSTEHERVVKRLGGQSVLFDACAGVGPFSIPAAKKCSKVFANDLNPESYKWLLHNSKLNKVKEERLQCFNMDAREFLEKVFKPELKKLWMSEDKENLEIHVTMNLPAMAVTFVDTFQNLMMDSPEMESLAFPLPVVHVYSFSKAENPGKDVQSRCEEMLSAALDPHHLEGVHYVRNVAPNKEMMRVSFRVPKHVLFGNSCRNTGKRQSELDSSLEKRHCLSTEAR